MADRKGTTYFYSIIGIALVLLVLGIAGALGIEARRLTTNLKENLTVEVVLKDEVTPEQINSLQASIKGKQYVKNIKFVSKDEAAATLKKDLGEDFLDILGYNPLYDSYLINLYEQYANEQSAETVNKEIAALPGVKQLNFQKNELQNINLVIGRASMVILIAAGLLLAFAISLIFNTIRLAMFSNRFTIKTMQLFGATRWFIIKPFLGKSILNGLVSGFIACLLLGALLLYVDYTQPDLALQTDLITFAMLFAALVLFGILISFLSTSIAVLRYLRIKVDDLY
ncbi:MAG: cell division protein FtsX [Bacteroidetes bacterium]|nr:cell division protein FtsX [Bacteroidota bacterium]